MNLLISFKPNSKTEFCHNLGSNDKIQGSLIAEININLDNEITKELYSIWTGTPPLIDDDMDSDRSKRYKRSEY